MVAAIPTPPAAEAVYDQAQSAFLDAVYARALEDRRAGRNRAAIAGLEQVLAARPADVDARLNLGLSLLADGRLDAADAAFEAVLLRAPDYVDAYLGRAQVAARRGDPDGARAALDAADAVRPGDDPDIVALRATLRTVPPPVWRIDASVARSGLTNGLGDWTEASLSAARRLDAHSGLVLTIERSVRFAQSDAFLDLRYDRAFGPVDVYVAAGGAPDATYRAELSLRTGVRAPIDLSGLAATFDGGVSEYVSGTVTTAQPGLERSFAGGRMSIGARWINVWDEQGVYRSGYSVGALWNPGARVRFRAGYADAPESSDGATVEVSALSLGLEVDFPDRFTVRIHGLREARHAYDRSEVGLGVGWRY